VLIDRGGLTLDTPVGSLSPEYRGFISEKATILNLLTHNSGIYDYYDEENEQDFDDFFVEIPWYKLETPTDYFPLFVGKQPKFEPGERYSYSNDGFVFLGMIIEKLTGQRYRNFIQNEVLLPAGMNRSGFYAFNDLPENTAKGYLSDRKTTNIYNLPIRGGGDGGMYTTAGDLNAFWERFLSYKLLSEELTKRYLQTYSPLNERSGYGCGIYKRLDESMFFIVGGDAGVGFDSRFLVEEKTVISILSNITDGEEAMRETIMTGIENGII
jgi:CubicO group peptidase (beta-lactamase class C family)